MSWELLPTELRVLILSFRHEMRDTACKIIQKKWGKYFAPKYAAIDIALELEIDENDIILTMWKSTSKIMKYCSHVLTGRTHKVFWTNILLEVNQGLKIDKKWVNESTRQMWDDRAVYYYRILWAYNILMKKFE